MHPSPEATGRPPDRAAKHSPRASVCEKLYAAHGRSIYNFLRFHVDAPDVAEDLTAETFFRILRAEDRFDPGQGSYRTWLFAIARNVLRDHLRRAKVRRVVPAGLLRDLVCSAPSPEERLLFEEDAARLLRALADLDAGDRDLISLRYTSGLGAEEIGAVLGIKPAAVRTRLWRALKRLRSTVGEDACDDR